MVIEGIITIGLNIAGWLISLFPPVPTQQLQQAITPLEAIGSVMVSMSVWVNWFLVGAQVLAVLGLYFTTLLLRIVRALLGHLPVFGGNG